MKVGLTPIGQPLDKVVNKVFKGYLRDLYDIRSLTDPVSPWAGHQCPPYRQLLATWIVQAWGNTTKSLCRKAWNACGYKTQEELAAETSGTAAADQESAIINFSSDQVAAMVSKEIGVDDAMNFIVDLVVDDTDPEFDEADDECYD